MQFRDGRAAIVGAQRVQERSSRSRVRITLQELFSIWLGGRITSPRVWFRAGRQGVTLKLAWGPRNSSLRNLHFVFAVFFLLLPLIIIILLSSFFPFFHFWAVFLFRATWLIVSYILNPVVFSVAQKSLTKTLFLKIEIVYFALIVLCIFLPLFFLWRFSCIIHFKLVILR